MSTTIYTECEKHPNTLVQEGELCPNCAHERAHETTRFPEGAEL